MPIIQAARALSKQVASQHADVEATFTAAVADGSTTAAMPLFGAE
jgi:hypothetical protein